MKSKSTDSTTKTKTTTAAKAKTATKSAAKTGTKTATKTAAKTPRAKTAKSSGSPSVTFEYFAPEAKEVKLAGSFNDWNADGIQLKKEKSGRWKIEMALEPGRYEYRYLVDGNWQNDQRPVACVHNPYGECNCVIEVGADQ